MFAKTALVGLFAAFAAAQVHAPTTQWTNGENPIYRPLNEAVVAGTPFTITWDPSTSNTVSLLLLKGPSNNVVPIGEPIAEGIENSGTFTWTPPADFGAGLSETTGYGIQLVDDVTGLFQYSNQFGITIPDDYKPSSSVVPTSTSTKGGYGGYPTETPKETSSSSVKKTTSYAPSTIITATTSLVASTGYPIANSSILQPSKPLTVPSSLLPSSTNPALNPPESTGAASHLKAGLGLMAGAAGMFFML